MTYADYVEEQSRVNAQKFTLTSVTADEVEVVSNYYRVHASDCLADDRFFGLCHGVRNGAEIRAFARRLGRRFVGTDISRTIMQVPDGILCDFSYCPDLWTGHVDFLYSNAYDHAADLDVTLAGWRKILSARGYMFLQFTPSHAHDTGLGFDELMAKIKNQGFDIQDILEIKPARGLERALNACRNAVRQIGKRIIGPLITKSSRYHWEIGHTLRYGILVDTKVIVARARST
jgi:hypothetical protein